MFAQDMTVCVSQCVILQLSVMQHLKEVGKKALLCHKTAFVNRCPLSVNCLNSLELLKKNMFFDCDNEYEMEKMNHSFNLTKI